MSWKSKNIMKIAAFAGAALALALGIWFLMARTKRENMSDDERREKARKKLRHKKKKECGDKPDGGCDGGAWKCKRNDDGSLEWRCKSADDYRADECASRGDPWYWDPNEKDCIDSTPDSSVGG